MPRASKLNIAENDGVWHQSFCTCLYRPGTDASFFSPWRRHPTLHPTRHIPKLHQEPLEIFLGEIPQAGTIPGSLLELLPTFHFSPCFFHVLSCPSKELPMATYGLAWAGVRKGKMRLVVICVVICFVMFCPIFGLGLWMLPAFFEEFRTSPIPLE